MMIPWWWALIALLTGLGLGALLTVWWREFAEADLDAAMPDEDVLERMRQRTAMIIGAELIPNVTEAEVDMRLAKLAREIERR